MSGGDPARLRRFLVEPAEGEAERPDLLLGRLAVDRGLLDDARLADCLAEQEAERARGGWIPLGQVLLRRGIVDAPGLDGLLVLQRGRAEGFPELPRYELRGKLGEGATAVVWRAWDRELERPVAVKILKETLGGREEIRRRFIREAQAVAQISHPHVVAVHDMGEARGWSYLVMELVDGVSLDALFAMHPGPSELRRFAGILRRVAAGVAAAQERGIVHRDLKPANILVAAGDQPKVGDFGLAQVAGAEGGLTRSGAVMGTPLYMAPEQVRGLTREIGPATDVYALGAILYEAAAGRTPHSGGSLTEIYGRIVNEEPDPLRRTQPAAPRDYETIVLKALEKDPAKRYPGAKELGEDLQRWLDGEPVLARPPGPIARLVRLLRRNRAAAAALAGLLIASLAWTGMARWSRRQQARQAHEEGLALEKESRTLEAREHFRRALELGDGSALASIDRVDRELRRREDSEREAQRLMEEGRAALDRAQAYIYRRDADLAGILQEIGEGRRLLERAAELAPHLPLAQLLLGRAWELEGRADAAEKAWRKALEVDPGFAPARYRLGRLLLERAYLDTLMHPEPGRPERLALDAAEEIERALQGRGGIEDAMQRTIAQAMVAYCRRDLGESRRIAMDGIASFGKREGVEEFHWVAGISSEGAEKLSLLDEAIRRRPRYVQALFTRSGEYIVAGKFAEAERDLQELLRLQPAFAYGQANLGVALLQLGRLDEAVAAFDETIRLDPSLTIARINRAIALQRKGDLEGAFREIEEAMKAEPDSARPWLLRAMLRSGQGDRRGAEADYDEAVRRQPESALAWMARGSHRSAQGDAAGAIADYSEALRLDPKLLKARINRARLLSERGDIPGAAADLKQALELAPDGSPERERVERALRDLER